MSYRTTFKNWSEAGLADREYHYYKELSGKGYDIYLFTYGDHRDENLFKRYKTSQNINFIIMPMCKKPLFLPGRIGAIFNAIFYIIQNRQIFSKLEFVKSKQMSGAWLPFLISQFFNAKFIFRFGFNLLEFNELKKIFFFRKLWNKFLVNIYLKFCYRIIGTVQLKYSKYNSKFILQENWIDVGLFQISKKKRLRQLQLNRKFLTIARLEEQKNILFIIKVLGKLNKKLVIIGEGTQKKNLKNFVKKNKFDIKFLGQVSYDEIIKNCKKYIFYISGSKFEGNPKSIIEAMAAGMICILPNVVGISNLVVHEKNGFLYNGEEKSLIKLILKINSMSPKNLSKISEKAKNIANKRFNIQVALKKEQDIYV